MKTWFSLILILLSGPTWVNAKQVNEAVFAVSSGILSHLLAKELCSCIFITGAYEQWGPKDALNRCMKHASLPLSEDMVNQIEELTIVDDHTVRINPKPLSFIIALKDLEPAIAIYHRETPEYGCSLQFD